MTQPMYLTREGLEKPKSELEHLRTVRRPDVAEQIKQSRERGGTVGNAEYEDARNESPIGQGLLGKKKERLPKNFTQKLYTETLHRNFTKEAVRQPPLPLPGSHG